MSKDNKVKVLVFTALFSISIGMYFYMEEVPQPVVKVVSMPKVAAVKVKSPKVKLKAHMTACQQLKVTIPLDSGFITKSDDMRVAKGYVENIGDVPVQFVQVQIIWKNKDNKSVDASTVFATTDDILEPGEKVNFQTSKRNYLITRCNVRVIDWWVVDKNNKREKGAENNEKSGSK